LEWWHIPIDPTNESWKVDVEDCGFGPAGEDSKRPYEKNTNYKKKKGLDSSRGKAMHLPRQREALEFKFNTINKYLPMWVGDVLNF
jgi:hypothetical protein